ncbi:MAG: peptidylprolyl isomerase, partial [Acidobacteriota bacterium]
DTAAWERAKKAAETLAAEAKDGRLDLTAEAERRRPEVPPRYRDQTGDLGAVHRGVLPAAADDAVFAARVGDLVGPVQTIFGFSVLEVESVEPPRQLEFDEVREAVLSKLLRERREAAMTGFESKLLAAASVERGPTSAAR